MSAIASSLKKSRESKNNSSKSPNQLELTEGSSTQKAPPLPKSSAPGPPKAPPVPQSSAPPPPKAPPIPQPSVPTSPKAPPIPQPSAPTPPKAPPIPQPSAPTPPRAPPIPQLSGPTPPKPTSIPQSSAPTPPRAPPAPPATVEETLPSTSSLSSSVADNTGVEDSSLYSDNLSSSRQFHDASSSMPSKPPPPMPSSGPSFKGRKHAPPPPPPTNIRDPQLALQQTAGKSLRNLSALSYTISAPLQSNGNKDNQPAKVVIEDKSKRFRFVNANSLPAPRRFEGHNKTKLYPSGRGSSMPLHLSLYS